MKTKLIFIVFVLLVAGATTDDDVAARLAQMLRLWTSKPNRFTLAEWEEALRFWAKKHTSVFTFEKRGNCRGGV